VVIILFIFRINADDWIVVRLLCSCLRCPRRFCSSADKLLLLFNLHILIYFFAINRQQPSVLRVSDLREILRGGGTPDPRDPYYFAIYVTAFFAFWPNALQLLFDVDIIRPGRFATQTFLPVCVAFRRPVYENTLLNIFFWLQKNMTLRLLEMTWQNMLK